ADRHQEQQRPEEPAGRLDDVREEVGFLLLGRGRLALLLLLALLGADGRGGGGNHAEGEGEHEAGEDKAGGAGKTTPHGSAHVVIPGNGERGTILATVAGAVPAGRALLSAGRAGGSEEGGVRR